MEAELKRHILACAQQYSAALGIPITTALRRANDTSGFYGTLIGSKTFTVRLYDRTMLWFSENWPKNTPWPEKVPRPKAQSRSRQLEAAE